MFEMVYPLVSPIIDDDTYMDDSTALGQTESEVSEKCRQLIHCLKEGSFETSKALSDNKHILENLPSEVIHPSLIEQMNDGDQQEFQHKKADVAQIEHPVYKEVVLGDAKALGLHFKIDLNAQRSFLTYEHWKLEPIKEGLSKRHVARMFARCWNPLQEMAPVTNPAKVCLSKLWNLQKLLQTRMIQCRYDLKEKKNYRPLQLRKDQGLPTNWHEMQKHWPKVDWDTKIFVNQKIDLNLDQLPEIEKLEATKLLHEILNDWQLFERNITDVLHRVVPRCNYTEEKHTTQNIKEKLLFIMSDASGGDKFGLLGTVAYLRIEYTDKSFTWQNLASMCKIAPANMTIVVRELRALLLSIKLAEKCQKAL